LKGDAGVGQTGLLRCRLLVAPHLVAPESALLEDLDQLVGAAQDVLGLGPEQIPHILLGEGRHDGSRSG
jgi:hypothetical protein